MRPGIGTTNVGAGNVSGVLHFDGAGDRCRWALHPRPKCPALLLAVAQPTQYHNLGVPGAVQPRPAERLQRASSHAAAPPFSKPNSYFEFINRAGRSGRPVRQREPFPPLLRRPAYETGSQFYQAIAKGPALVTAWIGGNDFLFGATSGDPQGPANALITPAATFAANYGAFLGSLAGGLAGTQRVHTPSSSGHPPLVRNIAYFLDRATFEAVFGRPGAHL